MKWLPIDLVLVSGWRHTAWPFLAGTVLGGVVVALTRRPGGRGSVPAGLVIWAYAVVGGLLLRRLTNQGTAAAFVVVVVATLVLGFLLVGPRAGARALARTPPVG